MKKISITEKMILYFLMIGFFSIAMVGLFAYFKSREAIMDRTLSQLTSLRVAKTRQLQQFFTDRMREINLVSRLDNTSAIFLMLGSIHQNNAENLHTDSLLMLEYHTFTEKHIDFSAYYKSIIFIGEKGMLIFNLEEKPGLPVYLTDTAVNFLQLRTIYKQACRSSRPEIYDFTSDSIHAPALYIASKSFCDIHEKAKGVLCFEIAPASLNKIMLEQNDLSGLGKSGETYLVGEDTLMRSSSRFIEESLYKIKVNSFGIREAMQGRSGTEFYPDYRNISVLGSYGKTGIEGINWVITAEIDMEEAMHPVYLLLYETLFLSIFILLILFIFTYFISKKITRPIIQLKKAAEKIGEGDFNIAYNIKTGDEIGELASAVNIMAGQIRNQTSELKEREQRLKHFYKATLDGIVIHDDGKPILINQALCNLTGFCEAELMDKNVYEIIEEFKDGKSFKIPLKPYIYETFAIRKKGPAIPVEVQESAIEYSGGIIRASVIRDITKRIDIENQLREERLKRLSWVIDGQEIERQRLSRELHDGLGQSLIALKLKIENIEVHDEKNSARLDDLRILFNKTIDEIRRISYNLMPAGLKEFGIVNAIRNLCVEMEEHTGIKFNYDADIAINHLKINSKNITYLYRIAQEAINNSVKHSGASVISVNIAHTDKFLVLSVADNGKGFIFDKTHKFVGNGMYNMRERTNMLHGSIEVNTGPGKGTAITVHIPIELS